MLGSRVWVKGVDMPFFVNETPRQVLESARTCGLAEETMPMVALTNANDRGKPIFVDPWSIVAVNEFVVPSTTSRTPAEETAIDTGGRSLRAVEADAT